jgi:hypothetical protein
MKVITNDKLIKRNGRLGQIATFTGLAVLIGGMFVSFKYQQIAGIAWIALLIGFALSQVGLYFGNRWGRHPRPDELLDQGLKGLNDQFTIYHYQTPAAHLLVGPTGLWVLMPYYQVGKIVYEKGRWKQKGGGFMQKYLRLFAQEGIGRPDLEGPSEAQSLTKFLKNKLPDGTPVPEPRPVLVFLSEKAELEVDEAPIPTLAVKKLKDTIRKNPKEYSLTPLVITEINNLFS